MHLIPRPKNVLPFLFFLSGAAALIYEVVWTRWLTGYLGSAATATAIVLAVFMAGLGLGSWLASRVADRIRRPVRVYAWLELGIAALAILPLWELRLSTSVIEGLVGSLSPMSPWHDVVRVAASLIALGPPTILMGASLPVVVRVLANSSDSLGRSTATAYAANSLGGVVGTLAAGFYLIETIGLRGSCWLAIGISALTGVVALQLARLRQFEEATDGKRRSVVHRRPTPSKRQPASKASQRKATWLLIAIAVPGFCALGYETIWSRVLSVFTLNTTYALSLMLAILLLGLSLGSWLVRSRLDGLREPATWFVAIQSILAIYALSSLLWAPWTLAWAEAIVPGGPGLGPWLGRPLAMATILVLIPTVLMGASLPVACKLYASETPGIVANEVGRPVGRAYAANTMGSVLGALVMGLFVIPSFGTWWAIVLCGLAGSLSAFAVARICIVPGHRPFWSVVASGTLIAVVALGVLQGGPGVVRQGLGPHEMVVFRMEDPYGLVEVTEDQWSGTRWMRTNRLHWEGSTLPRGVAQQRKQGLLPLLLHRAPKRVLEIGLGTGIKLGALESPVVQEAIAVEISPGVIRASRFFSDYHHGVGSNASKVKIVCADGRNFVASTPKEFDVIVNGLLTPYHAAISRLYTAEHFRACRAKLAPNGMLVVWVAIRQIAVEDLKTVTRTLLEVFPHTILLVDGYYMAFVATSQPLELDAEEILHRSSTTALANVLNEAGLDSPLPLLATFVAGPQRLASFAEGQPPCTEDCPIIEFRTPRMGDRLNSPELAAEILGTISLLQEPICPVYVNADEALSRRITRAQQARWISRQALIDKCYGRHIEAAQLFQQALSIDPTDDLARYELETYLVAHGEQCVRRGLLDQARYVFRKAVQVNDRSIGALASLAILESRAGRHSEAKRLWQRALMLDPNNPRFHATVASANFASPYATETSKRR